MKILIAVAAAIFALAVGFLVAGLAFDQDATSVGPVPSASTTPEDTTEVAPTTTEETTTGTETEPSDETVTYQVWFVNDEGLFVTYRTEPATQRVGTKALESLLEGPDTFEDGYGLSTAIPEGTQLLGLTIEDGIATRRPDLRVRDGRGKRVDAGAPRPGRLHAHPVPHGEGRPLQPRRRADRRPRRRGRHHRPPARAPRLRRPPADDPRHAAGAQPDRGEPHPHPGQRQRLRGERQHPDPRRRRQRPRRDLHDGHLRHRLPRHLPHERSPTRSTRSRTERSSSTTTTQPAPAPSRTRCASPSG